MKPKHSTLPLRRLRRAMLRSASATVVLAGEGKVRGR